MRTVRTGYKTKILVVIVLLKKDLRSLRGWHPTQAGQPQKPIVPKQGLLLDVCVYIYIWGIT